MGLRIILKLSLKEIFASKMRSFLTMLGVIVGVFSIILIVSLGRGATASITSELEKEANTISVSIMTDDKTMTYEEIKKFYKDLGCQHVSPTMSAQVDGKVGNTTGSVSLNGVGEEYNKIMSEELMQGRNISTLDVDFRSKVVILNFDAYNKFFKGQDALGKFIQFQGDRYKVIGVLGKKDTGFFNYTREMGYIPVTSMQVMNHQSISSISVTAPSKDEVEGLVKKIEAGLNVYYETEKKQAQNVNEDPFARRAFRINTAASMLDQVNKTTDILSMMLGGIASISLLVGGIGIMNIMFVSVSERTREIGIRKSLGAERRDILIQFLIEASVVSGFGGAIGICLAKVATYFVGKFSPIDPVMGIDVTLGSFIFSLLIGVVFGVYPAYKAAKLKPIDALRFE